MRFDRDTRLESIEMRWTFGTVSDRQPSADTRRRMGNGSRGLEATVDVMRRDKYGSTGT